MAKTTKKKAAKKTAKKTASKKATKKTTKKAAGKATVSKMNTRASNDDIVQLILEDHKALKQLIKTMKDSDAELSERQEAFEEFAPLLISHAKPEEQTLYVKMKNEDEMREDGFEGDVEHQLADQLVEEIKRTTEDEDLWSARVKVLAELVEHHIEEEEEDMLPDFKKEVETEERMQLGQEFLRLKAQYLEMGGEDTVEESEMDEEEEDDEARA